MHRFHGPSLAGDARHGRRMMNVLYSAYHQQEGLVLHSMVVVAFDRIVHRDVPAASQVQPLMTQAPVRPTRPAAWTIAPHRPASASPATAPMASATLPVVRIRPQLCKIWGTSVVPSLRSSRPLPYLLSSCLARRKLQPHDCSIVVSCGLVTTGTYAGHPLYCKGP